MTRPTTRRAFIGTGMIAALALAGCGGGGSSSTVAAGAAADGGSETRVVKTVKGPVRVPAEPRRVVSVYPTTVSSLYDYGFDPVGVYYIAPEGISPRFRAKWEEATPIGDVGELDLTKIAALEPDLIVGADYEWNTNYYERLGRIAPTVMAPSTEWREAAHTIAAAVGAFEKLAALQKELTRRSAKIRNGFAGQLDAYRWDLVQGGGEGGEYLLYGPESGPGGVLTDAGVKLAKGSASVTNGEDASYSAVGVTGGLEGVTNDSEVGVLDGAGVIGYYATFEGGPKNEQILFAQPEYQALAAVRAGRTVPLADFLPAGYGDALALLDELEAGLRGL
ncbi:MAG TPA: ABC transporter substrate-binding protein [Solirubrobacterales bacterium]|nr:ABC transporter substrate-binding protein [Solirubrobacterales bacterium]